MSGGQLLMISDIEGCVPNFFGTDQNTSLCELSTYTNELTKFLTVNANNEIAFLGDYFDKGPGVASSIIGIAHLHAKFPSKVHIILGNRDINKFRIAYEIDLPVEKRTYTLSSSDADDYDKSGSAWVNSIVGIDSAKTGKDRLFEIAAKSMGGMANGVEKQIYPGASEEITYEWLYETFKNSKTLFVSNLLQINSNTSINKSLFIASCRYLFQNGNIVKHNDKFKVLISHAGGFNLCLLKTQQFFEGIITKLTPEMSYYDKMETCRRGLICRTAEPKPSATLTLADIIAVHQGLYAKFVNSFFDGTNQITTNVEPSNEYFLLQAMGLKPFLPAKDLKETTIRPADFVSFIQSCGGGCNFVVSTESDRNFLGFLANNKVEVISHGHVPHCMPHPLVFTRPCESSNSDSVDSIVFMENDTSNGNRPKIASGKIEELPLSYIELENGTNKYGIGFLNNDGTILKNKVPLKNNKNMDYAMNMPITETRNKQLTQLLIMGESLPGSELLDEDGVQTLIKFNSAGFAPLSFKGGKSRKQKNRKTRKNKNKKTRKRKLNKNCNHNGCKYH